MLYNPLEVDTLIIHPAKAAIVAARGISHSGLEAARGKPRKRGQAAEATPRTLTAIAP